MYKKLLTLFTIFTISLFLGGCTIGGFTFNLPQIPYLSNLFGGGATDSKNANLTYWSLFEPADIFNSSISSYQNTNPGIKVNFEERAVNNLDTYKDSLLADLKTNSSTPDIMRIHVTWLSDFKDYLEPAPTTVITPETFKSRFYKPAFDSLVLGNKVYGLPLTYDSLVLLYNKDIFASTNSTAPTTWSDFKSLSEKLTTKNGEDISIAGAAMGSADNVAHFSDILGLLINQSQVSLPEDMESKQMKDIITFYTNFVKMSHVWDRKFAYSPLSFAGGKVAMIFSPSWKILDVLAANPNINIGVAPVPQLPSDASLTNSSYPNFWVEVVNKNSKNKVAAWNFLNYLSSKEQQQAVFNKATLTRAFGEPYSDVDLQSELSSHPYLSPVYTNADNGKILKITDLSGNTPYVNILKTVVEGVLNGGNMDDLLKTAKAEYERLDKAK